MRLKTVLLLLLPACKAIFANDIRYTNDTVRLEPNQLIAHGALIAVGVLGVGVKPFVQARKWINHEIGIHKCSPADDILTYAPIVCYAGLDRVGIRSRRPLARS